MIPSYDDQTLWAVCDVLGDTDHGLTGSEIDRLLADCRIEDPFSSGTKRHRLYEALATRQKRDGCGNNVANFITKAMKPVRYTNEPQIFEDRRASYPHASAIAATCRWSVPQHPPKTLSSGNRLRSAAY